MEEGIIDFHPKTQRLSRAVVRVLDRDSKFLGSAFFISPTVALTARHIVNERMPADVVLQVSWHGIFHAKVQEILLDDDPNLDVALLKVGVENSAPGDAIVSVGRAVPLVSGAQLRIAGFADAVSSIEFRPATVTGIDGIAEATIIDPPPGLGMSGGPALSPDGQLRGMIWARNIDQGRGYCTPISSIMAFLERQSVEIIGINKPIFEYPALNEDIERIEEIRKVLILWRSKYLDRKQEFNRLSTISSAYQHKRATFDENEVRHLLEVAGELCNEFLEIPITNLNFASPYGLRVHYAVFAGVALSVVLGELKIMPLRDDLSEIRDDAYLFESAKRVFESANAMSDFLPDSLPRGFVDPNFDNAHDDLSSEPLFAATTAGSRVGIFSFKRKLEQKIEFVARPLGLQLECLARLSDGTIDGVAHDGQNRYRWQSKSAKPIMQYAYEELLYIDYLDTSAGTSPIGIDKFGRAFEIFLDGSFSELTAGLDQELAAAGVWRDEASNSKLLINRISKTGLIDAIEAGSAEVLAQVDMKSFWHDPHFDLQMGASEYQTEIKYRSVLGFPTMVLFVHYPTWTRLAFLDPSTLTPIRPQLSLGGRTVDFDIQDGRLLIVSHWGVDIGEPVLSKYALNSDSEEPISVFKNTGEFRLDVESFALYDGRIICSNASLSDTRPAEVALINTDFSGAQNLDVSLRQITVVN